MGGGGGRGGKREDGRGRQGGEVVREKMGESER